MLSDIYQIRHCPACGLRYPRLENHPFGERCPNCLGTTELVVSKKIETVRNSIPNIKKLQLEVLLDNIRSAWNVGSIFRTADGLGISKLHLCGITPTPENKAVRKTSLGAENFLEWEYTPNGFERSKELKKNGAMLIAIEQEQRSIPIASAMINSGRTVLILGNEVTGVDPEILDLCHQIIQIPMLGKKGSFNVEVAFGIAAFYLSNTAIGES